LRHAQTTLVHKQSHRWRARGTPSWRPENESVPLKGTEMKQNRCRIWGRARLQKNGICNCILSGHFLPWKWGHYILSKLQGTYYSATQRHTSADWIAHPHRWENLKIGTVFIQIILAFTIATFTVKNKKASKLTAMLR
jgi:hypothetical protein